MEKKTLAKVQGAFSAAGNITDVERLQAALTRLPLYASLEMVAEICGNVGILGNGMQRRFTPKLSLENFYEVAVALDKKLLGGVSAVASIEDSRELLQELGLSTNLLSDEDIADETSSHASDDICGDDDVAQTHQRRVLTPTFDRSTHDTATMSPQTVPTAASSTLQSPIIGEGKRRSAASPVFLPGTASTLPVLVAAVPCVWLSPNPSQKGRGPRNTIYLHDIPPSSNELNEHVSRLAERIRELNKNDSISNDRPKPRTVGDMLRLPQLTEDDLEEISYLSSQPHSNMHLSDSALSNSVSLTTNARKLTAEQQLASAIHNDHIRTNLCNAVIEHTYRRARDVGISTGSCMSLIQRGILNKTKQKELDRLEKKKQKLRDRFVL